MGVPKTSDSIQINIRMPNPSQDPLASSKAKNEELKDMVVLCTFKIKIDSQNFAQRCTKAQWPYPNQYQHAKPHSGSPASSKAPNDDLKDMNVLCTFKIKVESKNSEYGCTKGQWPYPYQYMDAKPQSGTSSILQSPRSGLKGHGCSLHLQNQDREPKFGSWVYQRPVTKYISRSRCRTPVRNLQCPPNSQVRT